MATRLTRVTLSIPWDDEDHEHPAGWGFDVLLGMDDVERPVMVIDFTELDPATGEPITP